MLNMSLRVSESAIPPIEEGGRSSVIREYCFACLKIAFSQSDHAAPNEYLGGGGGSDVPG